MSSQNTNRRTFLKLTALAGIGLYFPSCTEYQPHQRNQAEMPKVDTVATPAETVEAIIDLFKSENLVLLTRDDEKYEKMRHGFNKRVDGKYPKLIALPKNDEGISEAMKYAKQENLAVSVKSGGHSFEAFSSNEGGLVINMSLLNEIEWQGEEIVKIGPGVTLSQVYDAILPKQRIIPMGSCGSVGVGGLTLGGGYGLFSRELGLTCDSLQALTMIDGKGNIHKAQGDDEIMWACRGGNNGNFGIVSSLTFKTHKAPDGFWSHRFKAYKMDAARAKNLLKTWFENAAKLPDTCFSAFVMNGTTLTLLITNSVADLSGIQYMLDAFEPITDKMSIGSKQTLAPALKRYYGIQTPLYFKNASAGLYNDWGDVEASIDEVIRIVAKKKGLIYQVNTLGGQINNADFEAASAYPHRSRPFLAELQAYYDGPGAREDLLLEDFETIQSLFTSNGVAAHYRNYPDINFKNWDTAYYADNYSRLQDIKRKYDPDNLIRHEQSVKG